MSASLQQPTCWRPQQRCLQLPCRAEQGFVRPPPQQQAIGSRRSALSAALLLPAAAALVVARPAVAEELAAPAAEAEAVTPPSAVDMVSWPQWVDRNFTFSYPPGFKEADRSYAAPPMPHAGLGQVPENPLKAEVRSQGGLQRISVIVRQATSYKRTLFQVTDISQLGDPRQVAKFLIPPGAMVASVTTAVVAQPATDTGTVLGVIERPPVVYYTYGVVLPDADATHVQLTAAAQLGRLYVLAASAPSSQWPEAGPLLREAALSFRVRYKV